MVGAYRIIVSNKYLKYEFVIKRNITVIKGNSATGKTTLIEMIREYTEEEDSGITVQCDKKCVVLYGKDWEKRLKEITDSIVFIDESGRFTKSTDLPLIFIIKICLKAQINVVLNILRSVSSLHRRLKNTDLALLPIIGGH